MHPRPLLSLSGFTWFPYSVLQVISRSLLGDTSVTGAVDAIMVALKSALSTRSAAPSVSVRTLAPSNALRSRVLAPRALPVELTDALVNSVAVAVNPIASLADGTVDVVTNTSAAGAGAFSIAGLFSGLLGNRKVAGLSAAEAYQYLIKEPRTILLDIRNKSEAATGTPDLKEAKKRVLSLPYTRVSKGKCMSASIDVSNSCPITPHYSSSNWPYEKNPCWQDMRAIHNHGCCAAVWACGDRCPTCCQLL